MSMSCTSSALLASIQQTLAAADAAVSALLRRASGMLLLLPLLQLRVS
jgi:hypothetical protein